jgi:hypothetical protein
MTLVNRFTSLIVLALASVLTGTAANQPILLEQSRTFSAPGAFGCTVSGATVATPSVITCSAAHNPITGDQVQITGVGGTTTDNTLAYVTVLSSTTFAIYSDAAQTMGITGTGTYTSGGLVSQAWDISGWVGDWTLFIVVTAASGGKTNVCLQDSVTGFTSADVQTLACVNQATQVFSGTSKTYSWRAYQFPSFRAGVLNARARIVAQSQDMGATIQVTAYLK